MHASYLQFTHGRHTFPSSLPAWVAALASTHRYTTASVCWPRANIFQKTSPQWCWFTNLSWYPSPCWPALIDPAKQRLPVYRVQFKLYCTRALTEPWLPSETSQVRLRCSPSLIIFLSSLSSSLSSKHSRVPQTSTILPENNIGTSVSATVYSPVPISAQFAFCSCSKKHHGQRQCEEERFICSICPLDRSRSWRDVRVGTEGETWRNSAYWLMVSGFSHT